MTSRRPNKGSNRTLAWVCIALGLIPLFISFEFIKVSEAAVHAPMWVIALCGIVFVLCGCMILLAQHTRLNNLFACIVLLSFAAIGIWVLLFSPSEGFAGGIFFLSNEANIKIARWVFGCGAVFVLILFAYAVRQLFRRDV